MLTQGRLKELLSYDPDTGIWTRLLSRHGAKARAGMTTGSIDGGGYTQVKIDGVKHRSCRLAFLYMTGEWPAEQVDHIDRDRANDRWANLREATLSQNRGNSSVRFDNELGVKGVTLDKRAKSRPFRAIIRIQGRLRHLGSFNSAGEASAAYAYAAAQYFGEFAVKNSMVGH